VHDDAKETAPTAMPMGLLLAACSCHFNTLVSGHLFILKVIFDRRRTRNRNYYITYHEQNSNSIRPMQEEWVYSPVTV